MQHGYETDPGRENAPVPVDLDLYVDSSGSMPDPRHWISYLALAGAIIALSALRAGASVQATLWSGKRQVLGTEGFVRDGDAVLRILTGFFGGATCFPIHRLRDTYAGLALQPTQASLPARAGRGAAGTGVGCARPSLRRRCRAAEQRARQIREALARNAAEESADKWTRE